MALVKQEPTEKLVDQFIQEAEDEEVGPLHGWYNLLKKVALGGIVKGFMTGIGIFMGSLVCHYYVLPHLNLEFYSLFLIKLHQI